MGHAPFGGLLSFGHAGVEFFFVLSGFIIYFTHRADLGQPSALASYGWKRLTRIVPLYWLILTFYFAKAQVAGMLDMATVLRSVTLFPQQPLALLPASWTLSHELLFYLLFAVAIAHRRVGQVLFLLWGVVILTITLLAPQSTAARFIASPYNLLFFLGIGVGWITTRRRVSGAAGIAALGTAGFFLSGYAEYAGWVRHGVPSMTLFGLFSALALLGLVTVEAHSRLDLGRTAMVMGDLSYPLYLVHGAVGAAALPLLCRPGLGLPDWAAMVLCTIVAVAAAGAIHRLFECPVQSLLLAIGPRRSSRPTLASI